MKVKTSECIDRSSFIGSLLLHCVTYSDHKELQPEYLHEHSDTGDGIEVDMVLTINGIEVDIESYMKRLVKHIDKEIEEKAIGIVTDKCDDISDMLHDLRGRVVDQISLRLADYEDESEYRSES